MDDLWERSEDGYYHSLSDLIADIELIVMKTISGRCINPLSKVYLTSFLSRAISSIKQKKEDYKQKWRVYYEAKYAQNDIYYPKVRGAWYKAPGAKREYNTLDNYKVVTP